MMSLLRLFRNGFAFVCFSCCLLFSSCFFDTGFDRLDVYNLKLEEVPVFGDLGPFLDAMGMPDSVSYYSSALARPVVEIITNRDSLNALLKPGGEFNLLYEGFEVSTSNDIITMEMIDFSETKRSLHYKDNIVFDRNFTLDNFSSMYPGSVATAKMLPSDISFYEMRKSMGKDSDHLNSLLDNPSYQRFLLERKSKYDPFATPLVEFTFKDSCLLAIVFLNF